MTFAQKGAIAFAAVILGMILTNIGFKPNEVQTEQTLESLKDLMSGVRQFQAHGRLKSAG